MIDRDIIDRVAALCGKCSLHTRPPKANWQTLHTCTVSGAHAAEIMHMIYPLMSARRKEQIHAALKWREQSTHGAGWHGTSTMTPKPDVYWLAGLLEGEGSFMGGNPSQPNVPCISVSMTDPEVIQRVAQLLGGASVFTRLGKGRVKTSYQLRLRGARAVAVMRELHPLMGKRRQGQIDRAIASYCPQRRRQFPRLLAEQALEVYTRAQSGESLRRIAQEMGVSYKACIDIKRGKSWGWLTGHVDSEGNTTVKQTTPGSRV